MTTILLTPDQQKLHSVSEEEKKLGYQMISPYVRPRNKSSHVFQKLEPLIGKSSTMTSEQDKIRRRNVFAIDTEKWHGLRHTIVEQSLPTVEIKKGCKPTDADFYEIRWVPNLLFNILKGIVIEFDNEIMTRLTSGYLFAVWQTHTPRDERDDVSRGIGNIPELEWNTTLPSRNLTYSLPTFYTNSIDFFPLLLAGAQNNFYHIIESEIDVRNLLQLSEVKLTSSGDFTRKVIPFDSSVVCIRGAQAARDEDFYLDNITMLGEYIRFNEKESSHNRCLANNEYCNRFSYKRVICEELVSEDKGFGQSVSHTFPRDLCPIHTLHWYAQNKDSYRYFNNHLNPTTKAEDFGEKGSIASSSLKKGESVIFNLKSSITEYINPLLHFCCVPQIKGLHSWTNCDHVLDTITPSGINLSEFSLKVNFVPQDGDTTPSFILNVIAEGVSYYRFENCPESEAQRSNHRSTFIVG